MNPNIEQAITQFLADEFHVDPKDVLLDTDFALDFGLNPDQLADFIERLQDALELVIPEEKIESIKTVGDLFASLTPETEIHESL